MNIVVIGGGAAGFFGAIRAAECNPSARVLILERGKEVLSKVRVSGGGRCNLTHACFIPKDLVKYYPRGEKELIGPFHVFGCGDTVAWFEGRGVKTKIEEDGRMFPVSNKSQSVIDCLQGSADKAGIPVLLHQRVDDLIPPDNSKGCWRVICKEKTYEADRVLVAAGSSPAIWEILARLGLQIVEPVPSLFTFNIQDERIVNLPGVSVPIATAQVEGTKLEASGPLLITHWGLSGPAILKLSAWGARELNQKNYHFTLKINWIQEKTEICKTDLEEKKQTASRQLATPQPLYALPSRLWKSLLHAAGIGEEKRWADVSKKELQQLAEQLTACRFQATGKSTFKDEFVTAGGVDLREINFKTFGSKRLPGLFFAGEILNIDAITGGFNFQAAWTGGWIAGEAMAQPLAPA